jgi:hypothetical protein
MAMNEQELDFDGDDLLVPDADFDGFADAIVSAYVDAIADAEGATDLVDADTGTNGTDGTDGTEVTYGEGGDAVFHNPDGSVSFSGSTLGGGDISYDSDLGVADYSSGFDVDY